MRFGVSKSIFGFQSISSRILCISSNNIKGSKAKIWKIWVKIRFICTFFYFWLQACLWGPRNNFLVHVTVFEFFNLICIVVKLRHCEKATKFEKITLLFWRLLSKSADLSKQEGDFLKFLWPFQKSWTLINNWILFSDPNFPF